MTKYRARVILVRRDAMTGEEVAVAVHAELGFIVISLPTKVKIGKIVNARSRNGAMLSAPLRIIREATPEDEAAQRRIGERIGGRWNPRRYPNAYCVEAAD